MISNRNLLFVNTAQKNKISTLKTAKALGMNVFVIGNELPDFAKPYVDQFFYADTYDTAEILKVLREKSEEYPIHGVVTFWDRDVMPVAAIAEQFNLYGSTVDSADQARNKRRMREALKKHGVPHPRFSKVTCWEDVQRAASEMDFPIILKPAGASSSKGIFKVNDPKALKETYDKMLTVVRPELDKMYSFYSGEFLMEEYMEGPEVSVEGIVSHGEIHIAGITEKWIDQYFAETQHAFPARVSPELEQELIHITKSSVKALGLDYCAFHAEVKVTSSGCKIVEVNGRLGGDFINTHLVPLATGIDMVEINLLTVMGEKINMESTKSGGACIRYLIAETAGIVDKWEGIEAVQQMPGVVEIGIEKDAGCTVILPPDKFYDTRLAYVVTQGTDTAHAIDLAEQAIAQLTCVIKQQVPTI